MVALGRGASLASTGSLASEGSSVSDGCDAGQFGERKPCEMDLSTRLSVYFELPALGLQQSLVFRVGPKNLDRVTSGMEQIVDMLVEELGADLVSPASGDCASESPDRCSSLSDLRVAAAAQLGNWQARVSTAESRARQLEARAQRADAQMKEMREAYYRELANLREQLFRKHEAARLEQPFSPDVVVHFVPAEYPCSEEEEKARDELLETRSELSQAHGEIKGLKEQAAELERKLAAAANHRQQGCGRKSLLATLEAATASRSMTESSIEFAAGGCDSSSDQNGCSPPSADRQAGTPPSADRQAGTPPSADRQAGGPPTADRHAGSPPDADRHLCSPFWADQDACNILDDDRQACSQNGRIVKTAYTQKGHVQSGASPPSSEGPHCETRDVGTECDPGVCAQAMVESRSCAVQTDHMEPSCPRTHKHSSRPAPLHWLKRDTDTAQCAESTEGKSDADREVADEPPCSAGTETTDMTDADDAAKMETVRHNVRCSSHQRSVRKVGMSELLSARNAPCLPTTIAPSRISLQLSSAPSISPSPSPPTTDNEGERRPCRRRHAPSVSVDPFGHGAPAVGDKPLHIFTWAAPESTDVAAQRAPLRTIPYTRGIPTTPHQQEQAPASRRQKSPGAGSLSSASSSESEDDHGDDEDDETKICMSAPSSPPLFPQRPFGPKPHAVRRMSYEDLVLGQGKRVRSVPMGAATSSATQSSVAPPQASAATAPARSSSLGAAAAAAHSSAAAAHSARARALSLGTAAAEAHASAAAAAAAHGAVSRGSVVEPEATVASPPDKGRGSTRTPSANLGARAQALKGALTDVLTICKAKDRSGATSAR
eukprot:gnl/TRDRNA2_/TRDRNA2_127696_c0_seq1.p1 gnl/TRDRNA2_/TRDRNA2_127696_c0~~gnl/TRDRNA2_/TRDRNA2_127696_c0_seq1.p1  ORF type:complete len:833 (+),score=105.05 gnl/TRDRNA2_/TRDRNA2_127696_c0_seq1:38-2536(+)